MLISALNMKDAKVTNAPADVTSSLHQAQIFYMKKIEKENIERVARLKKMKRNNLFTGLGLVGTVFGIYLYSILAVKQETFLDDLGDKQS